MGKIEIQTSVSNNKLERTVCVDGKEAYYDRRDIRMFPDSDDPVRALEVFLLGGGRKEVQCGCYGCCDTCYRLNSTGGRRGNIFGKFKQFTVQFFKIRP
jgi:hypothetical protein